jgi:cell division transport system permease protein
VAISSGYVARETIGNLRRNPVMTLSAIVTMAVSLSALGGVLLMRQAINKASLQWRGGVQMAIFLSPNVSTNETAAIGHELASTPGVKQYHFVNKPQAYQEFKEIFGGNNDIVGVLTVADMPPSYRVVPTKAQDIAELGRQFQGQPGVLQISYAQQEIDTLLHQFKVLRLIGGILAVGVMIGAVALIINTIQLAIYARRREVAVMKLVGATNWFIRVPFMSEGMIQGLLGSGLAALAVYALYAVINHYGNGSGTGNILGAMHMSGGEVILTDMVVVIVGVVIGSLGSAIAIRRFLDV